MKKLVIVLSFINIDSNAMLTCNVRNFNALLCLKSCVTKTSAIISNKTVQRCIINGADLTVTRALYKMFSSSLLKNNRQEKEILRKKTDYLNARIIDKKTADYIHGTLKKSVTSLNNSLKYGIVIGVFTPVITQKIKVFPVTLSVGASLAISCAPLYEWNQQIKLINYGLDHPLLDIKNLLKNTDKQFNIITKL